MGQRTVNPVAPFLAIDGTKGDVCLRSYAHNLTKASRPNFSPAKKAELKNQDMAKTICEGD